MLPNVLSGIVEARVALHRMERYMSAEELDPEAVRHGEAEDAVAVKIEGGSFIWASNTAQPLSEETKKDKKKRQKKEKKEKKAGQHAKETPQQPSVPAAAPDPHAPTLTNINMEVRKGELVAVVGSVGSGKSALISALLGEIQKLSGQVVLNGRVAYVSQQAWIQNASVRDNILFGKQMDQARYERVIQVCELESDMLALPAGDMTEIGEKGINLSGGQKQRVSMARAVYQDCEVYLMDDPLSAVDAHVGRRIFSNCIQGELKSATRILITHQLNVLGGVDRIYAMKAGTIEESSYDDILEHNPELKRTAEHEEEQMEQENRQKGRDDDDGEEATPGSSKRQPGGPQQGKGENASPKEEEKPRGGRAHRGAPHAQMTVEERVEGKVSWSIYKSYLSAIHGGYPMAAVMLVFFILAQTSTVLSNLWLSQWSSAGSSPKYSAVMYLGIYAALGLGGTVFVLARSICIALTSVGAAIKLHKSMLHNVMRARVAFFDTTPLGRMLNRFGKDLTTVDEQVPSTLAQFVEMSLSVLGIVVVVFLATPYALVPMLPLAYFYRFIQRYYVATSRELKRLDAISRSPIYTQFSETLAGLSTIRAYARVDAFIEENKAGKVDYNTRAYFASSVANRWLGVRLEFIGNCVVSVAALSAAISRGSIDPGLAGLSITYALGLTGLLNFLVRVATEVENQLVSVERVAA
eukprot:TRINITY_DN9039_c0_g1_i5.p1 TRINITY_DN9039_c0_g1~~TRINITY_DN9039_c0_g1_i5.p1  ORF type:complete len:716 (+),score=138.89 TRINITY_DN9039_c0_g1_i5:65-2149(+)